MLPDSYFQELFKYLEEVVFAIDFPELNFRFISSSVQKLFGVTPEEVYADANRLIGGLSEEDKKWAYDRLKDSMNGEIVEFEYLFSPPAGERKWLNIRIFRIKNPTGSGYMLGGIIRDVSERKTIEVKLERLYNEYEDLYHNSPNGFHSIDDKGYFLKINNTELNWLGYSREELVGKKKITDVITAEGKKTFSENFPDFKKKGYVNDLRLDFVRKDKSTFPALLNATAVSDKKGKFIMSRSVVTDISDLKKAQELLHKKNLEIQQINEELIGINEKLETINSIKDALLHIISHDLKNPLASIHLISDLLNEKFSRIDQDTLRHYLEHIREASSYAKKILDDMASIIQLETNTLHLFLEKSNITDIIREAVALNVSKAAKKGILLEFTGNPKLEGFEMKVDRKLLLRAIDNLLSNATKFTAGGGKVTISLQRIKDQAVITVSDTGIGIPPDMLPQIFERFSIVSRAGTAGETGTGLGLSIVQQIIDLHHGEVVAESEVGKGTEMIIRLPHLD